MASLNDIETKVRHIIDLLEDRTIKTITGVLPLTFTTTENKLRDWEIRGNDDVYEGQQGVGERTENLVESIENGSWSPTGFTKQVNTIRCRVSNVIDIDEGAIYTIFGETTGSISGMYLVQFKQDDGTSVLESGWKSFGTSVTAPTGATKSTVIIALSDNSVCQSTDFANIMLVKGSTAPSSYVPFGYEIPLTVNGTPQTFYIGDSPLTAGQSISKTSTGIDIATAEGENTISTTLYNKPEMTIKYK